MLDTHRKQWLERYASPLTVAIVALAILVLARTVVVDALLANAEVPPAVFAPEPTPTQALPPATAVSAVGLPADAAPVGLDISTVPVLRDEAIAAAADVTTYQGKRPQHTFETYEVKRGDTPIRIAEAFGIKAETLLGGNPRLSEEAGRLQVGDQLIILPVDGVLHDVQPGDTLESIALLYGVSVDAIIAYGPNNLEFPFRLYPNTQILAPGAVREVFKWDPPKLTSLISGNGYWAGQARPLIVGTGTYIWPTGGRNISQVYWYGHQAIDVAIVEGTSIFASDTGTVTYAAWSPYCYGNLIVVNHGNGAETFYAHLSGFNVVPGQIVYQGNVIGYSGNTGCSSGPHLHFEVRINGNRDDPMWWLP